MASISPVPLLSWLDAPRRGSLTVHGRDGDQVTTYEALAALARRATGGLEAFGPGAGDAILLVAHLDAGFVSAFFGALRLGLTVVPLAPPRAFGSSGYEAHLARAIACTGARLVVVESASADAVRQAVPWGVSVVSMEQLLGASPSEVVRTPPEIAVLQLTSGSSGPPKATAVAFDRLELHLGMIRRASGWSAADASSTWLPVHHDMGLVAGCLLPVCLQSDMYAIAPEDFIRRPMAWLRDFGESRAHATFTAPFGLEHVLRRVRPQQLQELDFSTWRVLVVGAERIDAQVLRRFLAALGQRGFRARALAPAYGMAEATLGVTADSVDEPPVAIARETIGDVVGPDVHPLDAAGTLDGREAVVGCGTPLPCVTIEIVDEDGCAVPEGVVGEVVVDSPALALGYRSEDGAIDPLPRPFATGDSALVVDGRLYVIGRIGDGLKVRGELVHAEDIEVAVAAELDTGRCRTTVVLGDTPAGPRVFVLLEGRIDDGARERIATIVRRSLATESAQIEVRVVPPRDVLRTTSGKPRRAAMWRRMVDAEVPVGGGCA